MKSSVLRNNQYGVDNGITHGAVQQINTVNMCIQVCTVSYGRTCQNKYFSSQIIHFNNILESLFHHIYQDKFIKDTFWSDLKDKDWESTSNIIVQHETFNIFNSSKSFKLGILN